MILHGKLCGNVGRRRINPQALRSYPQGLFFCPPETPPVPAVVLVLLPAAQRLRLRVMGLPVSNRLSVAAHGIAIRRPTTVRAGFVSADIFALYAAATLACRLEAQIER